MSAQQWRELIERFDASGAASVAEFCLREGVSKSAFHRQRAQFRAPASQPLPPLKPRFVDLGVIQTPSRAAGLEIRLDLGDGVTLNLIRR